MQTAQEYIGPKKSYKGKINDVIDATFYPLGCYVNGRYDVEVGYLLVTGGEKKDLEKSGHEIGKYYRYILVNFDGNQFAMTEKFSESVPTEEEISNLINSRIDVNITPKYVSLPEDKVCKDFIAKGVFVEKRRLLFEISSSHMHNTFTYKYGDFYFVDATSFQGYELKSKGMSGSINPFVQKKGSYFVCDVYGDEEKGRSLVLRGVLLNKDLMFIKQPNEEERRWEHIFIILEGINRFYSLSFFTTDTPSEFTQASISNLLEKFHDGEALSKKEDPIIFSTR
jgi:hypothetical protein